MKNALKVSGVALAGSALFVGCGHLTPSPNSAADQPRQTAVSVRHQGTGTLLVRTRFTGYRVQDVIGGGFTAAEVASIDLTVKDATGQVLATATLSGADIYDQLTFSNLPTGVLTILVQAKDASGTVRSLDSATPATVTVTESGVSSIVLTVQLADKYETGQNTTLDAITILPGDLITAGAVTISTSSPTPTPTEVPTPAPTPAPWDPATFYQQGDLVTYDGMIWRALAANQDPTPPPTSMYWVMN